MNPIGMIMAVNATRRHALSAQPDAPVVPDRRPATGESHRQRSPGLVRRAAAGGLRRLADRLEPRHPISSS